MRGSWLSESPRLEAAVPFQLRVLPFQLPIELSPAQYLRASCMHARFLPRLHARSYPHPPTLQVFFPTKLAGSFALFFLVHFVTTSTGIALAYFISALSPNMVREAWSGFRVLLYSTSYTMHIPPTHMRARVYGCSGARSSLFPSQPLRAVSNSLSGLLQDVANAAVPAYIVTLLFFAGNLMRFEDIPGQGCGQHCVVG
jgi:hypothetical protein